MPLVTKKKGTKKPKPTAVSFDSKTCSSCPFSARRDDHPGDEAAEQDVEAELAGEQDEAEDEDDGDPHRQLAARLEGPFQRRPAAPGVAHRDQREDQRQGDEGEQDRRLVQRVGGREDEGDEQDRAELAGAAGRQQVGAELGLQLAVVAQDRDQRADRRRRHRRAGVEEGDDDPGRGEDAADPVGERRPRAASPRRRASSACP